MKCKWPDCDKDVPSNRWTCRDHYYMLPYRLRMKLHAVIKGSKANHDPAEVEQELIGFAKGRDLLS